MLFSYNRETFLNFYVAMIRIFIYLVSSLIPFALFADSQSHPMKACHEFLIVPDAVETEQKHKVTEYQKGLLWKAEKDGKTNYVLGTIHSQDYSVTRFSPPVRLALVKTRTLLMETIPDESANEAFFSNMYFADNTRLDELLGAELFAEFRRIALDYGLQEERLAEVKPWAAFSLIGRPKPVRAASQEQNLFNLARQTVSEIKSLESMEEIIASLESLSLSDQVTILKDTICNHANIIRDAKELVDLYVARDLAGIIAFNNKPHHDEALFERFMQAILYNRNDKVMQMIEQEFARGDVFVAIGASHLVDERSGILQQLAEKGYKLSPVY